MSIFGGARLYCRGRSPDKGLRSAVYRAGESMAFMAILSAAVQACPAMIKTGTLPGAVR